MNKFGKSIAVCLVLGIPCVVPSTVNAKLTAHFTVRLVVTANNDLKSIVLNDMTKELKKLPDVEVTDVNSAAWILYLNVTPIIDATGVKGYIFSTVIVDQYSAQIINDLPKEDFKNPEVADTVKRLAKNQVTLRDHMVDTCPTGGLQKTYAEIVDYFDENYLMPAREDISNFDLLRKTK